MTKHTVLKWIVDRMEDEDIEMVVKVLVNTRLPHLYLARKPGPRVKKPSVGDLILGLQQDVLDAQMKRRGM